MSALFRSLESSRGRVLFDEAANDAAFEVSTVEWFEAPASSYSLVVDSANAAAEGQAVVLQSMLAVASADAAAEGASISLAATLTYEIAVDAGDAACEAAQTALLEQMVLLVQSGEAVAHPVDTELGYEEPYEPCPPLTIPRRRGRR